MKLELMNWAENRLRYIDQGMIYDWKEKLKAHHVRYETKRRLLLFCEYARMRFKAVLRVAEHERVATDLPSLEHDLPICGMHS